MNLLDVASCVVVLLELFVVLCSASEKIDLLKGGTMVLIFAIAEVMVLCGGQPTVAMSGAVKIGIEPKRGVRYPRPPLSSLGVV